MRNCRAQHEPQLGLERRAVCYVQGRHMFGRPIGEGQCLGRQWSMSPIDFRSDGTVALEAATQAGFRAMAARGVRMATAVAQELPPPRAWRASRAREAAHLSSHGWEGGTLGCPSTWSRRSSGQIWAFPGRFWSNPVTSGGIRANSGRFRAISVDSGRIVTESDRFRARKVELQPVVDGPGHVGPKSGQI